MHRLVRTPRRGRLAPVALALSLTAGALTAAATPTHVAAAGAPAQAAASSVTRLSAAQASTRARASGQGVVADALTERPPSCGVIEPVS